MLVITENATILCAHKLGQVAISASQHFVRINGQKILVEPDPVAKGISGCPNVGPSIKPCTGTLAVQQGYSQFVRIGGRRICLSSVTGLTDGTPPGMVKYDVQSPGQSFVSEKG